MYPTEACGYQLSLIIASLSLSPICWHVLTCGYSQLRDEHNLPVNDVSNSFIQRHGRGFGLALSNLTTSNALHLLWMRDPCIWSVCSRLSFQSCLYLTIDMNRSNKYQTSITWVSANCYFQMMVSVVRVWKLSKPIYLPLLHFVRQIVRPVIKDQEITFLKSLSHRPPLNDKDFSCLVKVQISIQLGWLYTGPQCG